MQAAELDDLDGITGVGAALRSALSTCLDLVCGVPEERQLSG